MEATETPPAIRLEWKETLEGAAHEAVSQLMDEVYNPFIWAIDYEAADEYSIKRTPITLKGGGIDSRLQDVKFSSLAEAMAWCQERETDIWATRTPPDEEKRASVADNATAEVHNQADSTEPKKPFDIVEGVEKYIAKALEDAENDEETITAKVLNQRNTVARLSIAMLRMDQGKKTIKERYEEAVEMLDMMEKDAAREVKDAEAKKFQPDLPFGKPRPRLEWETAPHGKQWNAMNTAGVRIDPEDSATAFAVFKIDAQDEDGKTIYIPGDDCELLIPIEDEIRTFDTLDGAKVFCQARDDQLFAAGIKPPEGLRPDSAPDPRLSIRLDTLEIKPALIKKLAENSPPMVTVGDVANWCNQKSTAHGGNNEIKDVKGIGETDAKNIEDALEGVWMK